MNHQHLLESNRAATKHLQVKNAARLAESIKASYGVDVTDKETFAFGTPGFSWSGLRESAYALANKLREANAEGVFGALLRAGVNNLANTWYELVETNHEKIGATTVSNKLIELHAPLHRGQVPRRVQRGQKFPETRLQGLDIQIQNEKFGAVIGFERELFDDDQTGQISQRAQDIGENMRILEDAWFFTRFVGTAGSYAGDVIPASQTYPGGVFSTTAMEGGGINAIASAAFSSGTVQTLDLLLMNMLDLLGNKMLVNPNTLLTGTSNKFSGRTLLNSEWYPSTVAVKVGGSGADTTVGTAFARNVLDGLYNLVVSRFLPQKGYWLGEAGKGIIMQRRDPLELVQENPTSGAAFETDEFRFRSRARWEPDWIDPRFWAQGNNGSV